MPFNYQKRKPLNFAPDGDSLTPDILLDGNDFYPTPAGLRTLPKLIQQSERFPQPVRGSTVVTFAGSTGNELIVAGSSNYLGLIFAYNLGDPAVVVPWQLQDIGPPTAGTPPPPVNRWRFAFYNNQVFAVDGIRRPYVATDASILTPLSTWDPLAGNPPISSIVASSDYALWLIEANSATWHATLDPTNWVDSTPRQTSSATLWQTPGDITGARALRSQMVLYKRNSIFVGSITTLGWGFQEISRQTGAVSHESIVSVQDVHYFLGPDDFWTLDGYSLNRLPNQLRQWFFARANPAALAFVIGRYDEQRNLIFWHYSTTNDWYNPNEWIAYNVRTGQWTIGQREIQMSAGSLSMVPVTAGVVPGDTCGLFQADNALWFYDWLNGTDANPGSFFTTGDLGDRHYMYQLSRVRPGIMVNSGTPQLQLLSTYTPGGTYTAGPAIDLTIDGWFNTLNTARLQRLRVSTDKILELVDYEVQFSQVGDR